jgi:hypothetical protein
MKLSSVQSEVCLVDIDELDAFNTEEEDDLRENMYIGC